MKANPSVAIAVAVQGMGAALLSAGDGAGKPTARLSRMQRQPRLRVYRLTDLLNFQIAIAPRSRAIPLALSLGFF